MLNTEILKHRAEEYGGFQSFLLDMDEIEQRICCARYCAGKGAVQVPINFDKGFRVVCARHALLVTAMVLASLGDSSPTEELKTMAEELEVDWKEFLLTEPRHPTTPESFSCLRCGGGFVAETTGMFSGKRYIHTCGE